MKISLAGVAAQHQSFGVASAHVGFNDVEGVIGFGPTDLTKGTVSNTETVPTFMDNLYSQDSIVSYTRLEILRIPELFSFSDRKRKCLACILLLRLA